MVDDEDDVAVLVLYLCVGGWSFLLQSAVQQPAAGAMAILMVRPSAFVSSEGERGGSSGQAGVTLVHNDRY